MNFLRQSFFVLLCLAASLVLAPSSFAFGVSPQKVVLENLLPEQVYEVELNLSNTGHTEPILFELSVENELGVSIQEESLTMSSWDNEIQVPVSIDTSGLSEGSYSNTITFKQVPNPKHDTGQFIFSAIEIPIEWSVSEEVLESLEVSHFQVIREDDEDGFIASVFFKNKGNLANGPDEILFEIRDANEALVYSETRESDTQIPAFSNGTLLTAPDEKIALEQGHYSLVVKVKKNGEWIFESQPYPYVVQGTDSQKIAVSILLMLLLAASLFMYFHAQKQ